MNDSQSLAVIEQRIRDLESENAALKVDISALRRQHLVDRDLLIQMIIHDLPQSEAEYRKLVDSSRPFSELLREMEAKYGLEPPK